MLIVALFRITKMSKQPKCPLTGEWMKKHGIYIQWNTVQPIKIRKLHYATTGMNSEDIMLSEICQSQ